MGTLHLAKRLRVEIMQDSESWEDNDDAVEEAYRVIEE